MSKRKSTNPQLMVQAISAGSANPASTNWSPLIDAAREIGSKRTRLLLELQKAVLANDRETVFNIAQALVGGPQQ